MVCGGVGVGVCVCGCVWVCGCAGVQGVRVCGCVGVLVCGCVGVCVCEHYIAIHKIASTLSGQTHSPCCVERFSDCQILKV